MDKDRVIEHCNVRERGYSFLLLSSFVAHGKVWCAMEVEGSSTDTYGTLNDIGHRLSFGGCRLRFKLVYGVYHSSLVTSPLCCMVVIKLPFLTLHACALPPASALVGLPIGTSLGLHNKRHVPVVPDWSRYKKAN